MMKARGRRTRSSESSRSPTDSYLFGSWSSPPRIPRIPRSENMNGEKSPTLSGRTVSLGVKVDFDMDDLIQKMANYETNGNKSEMIRKLILEAVETRKSTGHLVNETTECETIW